MCDVGYLCANFGLPRPLCFRLRPDVRDRQTSDSILAWCPHLLGAGHNNERCSRASSTLAVMSSDMATTTLNRSAGWSLGQMWVASFCSIIRMLTELATWTLFTADDVGVPVAGCWCWNRCELAAPHCSAYSVVIHITSHHYSAPTRSTKPRAEALTPGLNIWLQSSFWSSGCERWWFLWV